MSWTDKYWDLVDQLYWSPQYLGLKSIPRRLWTEDEDRVSIPKAMTNSNGPLYRRVRSGEEFWSYVRRQEETFNQIFDLTFAVLPGDVVTEIFSKLTGTDLRQPYECIGRELRTRHFWREHDNITTPDGFFVNEESILAVELKFNAKTSLDQIAKYLLLFVAEEMVLGQRKRLDLLYIFNSDPDSAFKNQVGVNPGLVGEILVDDLLTSVSSKTVKGFLQENVSAFRNVLGKVNVRCIHWQDFAAAMTSFSATLQDGPGDRTLKRLIDGLVTEIQRHPLSNA